MRLSASSILSSHSTNPHNARTSVTLSANTTKRRCGSSSDTSDALLGQSGGHTGQAAACRTWPRPTQSHPAAPELLRHLLPAQVTETADSRLEVNKYIYDEIVPNADGLTAPMPLPRTSAVVAPGPHDVRGRRNSLRFTQPPSNLHTAAISFNIRRQIRLEPASDAPCSPFRPLYHPPPAAIVLAART